MKKRLDRVFRHETIIHAVRSVITRGFGGLSASANALSLGWTRSRLPLGSRVIGSKYIEVQPGFESAGAVWLEAIWEYAGHSYHPFIRIGHNFRCSGYLHLSAINGIEIGDDCLFGTNVFISDHGHGTYRGAALDHSDPHEPPVLRRLSGDVSSVKIGSRCWVGNNVVIARGIEIGDGVVIAANSVVTRDVPTNSVVAGAPARTVRVYSDRTGQWSAAEQRIR